VKGYQVRLHREPRTKGSNPFLSANFLNRNDSQAQLARWKCPATAMF
jgi:hypothetical protein